MTKSTKKKLIAIGICFVILVASILSNTIAYFTDDEEVSNTFTSGNVEITLTESKATLDNLNRVTVDNNERVSGNQDFGTLYPSQSFTKDPTITNVSTEAAYIAAKVIVSDGAGDLRQIIASAGTGIDIERILSGGLLATYDVTENKTEVASKLATEDYVIYQEVKNGNYVFYFFVKDAVAVNGTVELFETFSVPNEWDNEQMDQLKKLTIDVKAYGVQTFGFNSALEALEAAFSDEFAGFTTTVAP